MKPESEAGFLEAVLELACLCGWKCLHLRPARTAHGWRTAVQGPGKGFPDLLALHPDLGAFVAELKAEKGTLTPAQAAWLEAFRAVGIRAYLFRPRDWPLIEAILKGESS